MYGLSPEDLAIQAKLTEGPHAGEHAMFVVDLPWPGVRVVRTPAYSHTFSHHHPIVAFEDVRVPADQLVAAMLADSVTELFAARAMTYAVARGIDEGLDVKTQHAQCSMIKLYVSEMAGRVADRSVQIFGGRGYMRENVAERFFRELRVERIWEGTSEIQRGIIAAQLGKRGVRTLVG